MSRGDETTFLKDFSREVDDVARRMAVAPISLDEFMPRLRGVYEVPDANGLLPIRYVVAQVFGSYADDPSGYRDYAQICLIDDLPDPDQVAEHELLRENVLSIIPENDDISLLIAGIDYDDRPDRVFRAQRFIAALKAQFENGSFTSSPVTEAAARRVTDLKHLESQAKIVFEKWSQNGSLALDTYTQGHKTLVIEDKGETLHILTDWLNVVEDPETASFEDAVRMRGRTTLQLGAQGLGYDHLLETVDGTTLSDVEGTPTEEEIAPLFTKAMILANQMLELVNEYSVTSLDAND